MNFILGVKKMLNREFLLDDVYNLDCRLSDIIYQMLTNNNYTDDKLYTDIIRLKNRIFYLVDSLDEGIYGSPN